MTGNPLKSDWLHCNSMDYNQQLDQVVINSVHGEFYVIDHGNTFVKNDSAASVALAASAAGNFLYRFGDPYKYGQGLAPSFSTNPEKTTTGNKQIGGAHDIQWIKPGLQGEGNFMIFNNGQNLYEMTPQSYIVEINPFLNSSGVKGSTYVDPPTAGYNIVSPANSNLMKEKKNISKQVVWSYSSKNNTSFFSTIGSSAQRLPNGNTFICAMNSGHFFEVNPVDTSIVWEYINPFTRSGIRKIKTDTYPTDNAAFRAYRYTATHPALAGHDLTPGKTMTGFDPDYLTPASLLSSVPKVYSISEDRIMQQNHPNPFSSVTNIDFVMPESGNVSIVVYNLNGVPVKYLVNDKRDSGQYTVQWDGSGESGDLLPKGVYFYVFSANNRMMSKKMIYTK